MEDMPMPYPFGLVGARSTYQDAIHHLFTDHVKGDHIDDFYMIDLPKAGQPAPVVNMVSIHQFPDDSLHSILEESPNEYSQGSTETIFTCPTFSSRFGGGIYHISHNSITKDGETFNQCDACLVKNADRQCC
jgi:hypothetical protein